jgi:hypothetical protein
MAKLLINGEWFYELAGTSLYETEMENILFQQASHLFSSFFLIRFKKTLFSEDGSAKADFILIDKLYRKWWIIEVEMSDHSLEGHIMPQVRVLSRSVFGEEEIKYLLEKKPELHERELGHLVKNTPPKVLVIVNQPMPDWVSPLKIIDSDVMYVEIFRSDSNKHVFRIEGEIPSISHDFISRCSFLPYLPNILFIESPHSIVKYMNKKIKILYRDSFSIWELREIKGKVYLVPASANPLSLGLSYELYKSDDGVFLLHAIK